MIVPRKLRRGEQVRVIAPSMSLGVISKEVRSVCEATFKTLGLALSFGRHVEEHDTLTDSSNIASRIADLHDAFTDPSVSAVFTAIGGYNCNELLPHIEWRLIAENPKILCGYSDITVLANAIWAMTGLVTYVGPHYSTLGMSQGNEYTLEYLCKCLFEDDAFTVHPSRTFSDDLWYLDQARRSFRDNDGIWVVTPGRAKGTLIGGNLASLSLLRGTKFMPRISGPTLLALEEDDLVGAAETSIFGQLLEALLQSIDAPIEIVGFIVGRFQLRSEMTLEKLEHIFHGRPLIREIPCIANVDFGHTSPLLTLPIGGCVAFCAEQGQRPVALEILHH